MPQTRNRASKLRVRKTRLIVGEGPHEKYFLEHIKSLHHRRDLQGFDITVRHANGQTPDDILENAIMRKKGIAYDEVYILMDTDIPWTEKLKKKAERNKIILIGSEPICLEGMLLAIKGMSLPNSGTAQACKSKLKELSGTPFSSSFLNNHFCIETLKTAATKLNPIKQLIIIFSIF